MNFLHLSLLKIVLTSSLAFAFLLLSPPAEAGRHDQRQHHQRSRIRQGIKSGEMTKGETYRAAKQQRRIRGAEKRAEADGHVTSREKAKLETMQDNANKDIYRMKHNEKERGGDNPETVDAATTQ